MADIAPHTMPLPLQPSSGLFRAAISRFRAARAVLECQLRGGSMKDTIPAGSPIRISVGDPEQYRVGQVVAFVAGNGICVHRLVHRGRSRRVSRYVITQGDRCPFPDAPVAMDSVLGLVTEFESRGTWRPLGDPEPRSGIRRAAGSAIRMTVIGALEIDVRLARGLTAALRAAETIARAAVHVGRRLIAHRGGR